MPEFPFDELVLLLDKYAASTLPSDAYSYDQVLIAEAKKRLRQLRRLSAIASQLCNKIAALTPVINSLPPLDTPNPPRPVLEYIEAIDSLEMYTEAFYYLAWRLRQVIRRLPRLEAFDSTGVRTVRNHLLEHPERHGQDELWAFRISPTDGPILLRATTSDDDEWDRGLWPNLSQLLERLRVLLISVISPLDDPQSGA